MNRRVVSTAVIALTGLALGACAVHFREQGQTLYSQGNYLAAADAFTEEIQRNPRSAAAWNDRAVARVRLGDLNGALRDYNRAIELTPDDAEIYFNRGNALVAAGQYADALADFNRAIDLSPTSARALFNRGTTYALAGQPDAARRDWQAAVALEPDPYAKASMRRVRGDGSAALRGRMAGSASESLLSVAGASASETLGVDLPNGTARLRLLVPGGRRAEASLTARSAFYGTVAPLAGRGRLRGAAGHSSARAVDDSMPRTGGMGCSQSAPSIRKPPGLPDHADGGSALVRYRRKGRAREGRFVFGGSCWGNRKRDLLDSDHAHPPRAVLCPGCVHGG
jgi:tetratricopeptide (TPR) repeat protein